MRPAERISRQHGASEIERVAYIAQRRVRIAGELVQNARCQSRQYFLAKQAIGSRQHQRLVGVATRLGQRIGQRRSRKGAVEVGQRQLDERHITVGAAQQFLRVGQDLDGALRRASLLVQHAKEYGIAGDGAQFVNADGGR